MLDPDRLRVADYDQWLGCQQIAAAQLGCNQSTVSRRAGEVRHLAATRSSIEGKDFLSLERGVHQRWRFARAKELRLHGYRWIQPLLRGQLPESWRLNPPDVSLTPVCPLRLLDNHVIDALLAPWPLVADLDRSRFALFPVYVSPMLLLVAPATAEALVGETGLRGCEIAAATRLAPLPFVPPEAWDCSEHLDRQLFGPVDPAPEAPVAGSRYWGMALTPLIRGDLAVLNYAMPISYGEFLVCLQNWSEHGQLQQLLAAVRHSLLYAGRDRRAWRCSPSPEPSRRVVRRAPRQRHIPAIGSSSSLPQYRQRWRLPRLSRPHWPQRSDTWCDWRPSATPSLRSMAWILASSCCWLTSP